MQASQILQVLVVACLLGLAWSAPVADEQPARRGVGDFLCDTCQQVAQMAKEGLPAAVEQLKQLCQSCGSQENQDKCRRAMDKFAADVAQKSPLELCKEVGLCKKPAFLALLGL